MSRQAAAFCGASAKLQQPQTNQCGSPNIIASAGMCYGPLAKTHWQLEMGTFQSQIDSGHILTCKQHKHLVACTCIKLPVSA